MEKVNGFFSFHCQSRRAVKGSGFEPQDVISLVREQSGSNIFVGTTGNHITYIFISLKPEHVPSDHRESQSQPTLRSLRKPTLFKATLKYKFNGLIKRIFKHKIEALFYEEDYRIYVQYSGFCIPEDIIHPSAFLPLCSFFFQVWYPFCYISSSEQYNYIYNKSIYQSSSIQKPNSHIVFYSYTQLL